ncbi:MAG: ABC transporter permease [Planctomycetota bacterium]|jgi:putative ABC transport system permease protein
MTQWRIVITEIRRNGLRSALIALSVFLATAVMTSVVLLITGVNQGITHTVGRLGADLMVVPEGEKIVKQFNEALISGRPTTFYFEPFVVDAIMQIPGIVEVSAQTFAETLTNARCCAGEFFIVGFDPESDFMISPWLNNNASRFSSEEQNCIIVGDRILLQEGDTVEFYGTSFSVAGVLEPTSTGMDWTIYIPDRALREMVVNSGTKAEAPLRIPNGAFSAVFVKAAPDIDLIDLAEKIEQALPKVQTILSSSVAKNARAQMSTISEILICIVAILWAMSLVLSGAVFTQSVRERQSEIGLLMAKGADRTFMYRLFVKESGTISMGSSCLGALAGFTIIASFRILLANTLGAHDVLPSWRITLVLISAFVSLGTISGIIAAVLPVFPLLKAEPLEAIKRGSTL